MATVIRANAAKAPTVVRSTCMPLSHHTIAASGGEKRKSVKKKDFRLDLKLRVKLARAKKQGNKNMSKILTAFTISQDQYVHDGMKVTI